MLIRQVPWRRGILVTAIMGLLVTVELWALSLPALGTWQVDVFGTRSARSAAGMLDLMIMVPLGTIGLAAAWGGRPAISRLLSITRPLLVMMAVALGLAWLRKTGWSTSTVVVLVAAELALLYLLVSKVLRLRSVLGEHRRQGYSHVTSLLVAVTNAFRNSAMQALLRVAIAEVALLGYGAVGWLRNVRNRKERTFTSHLSEDDTVFIAVAIAIYIEIVPIHFLIHMYSPLAAWILTALSAYSLLWVLGDVAARRNRPHSLERQQLRLCYGLRWEAVVPLTAIVKVHRAGSADAPQPELTIGPEVSLVLELSEPVSAYGWFGAMSEVSVIGVGVDDIDGLLASLVPDIR